MKKLLFIVLLSIGLIGKSYANPFLTDKYWKNVTVTQLKTDIKKYDIKKNSEFGETALMWAINNNNNPDIITALIKNGANVNERDDLGFTALMWAINNNKNLDIITTLIKNGADVNIKNKFGGTALIFASANNKNPDVITTLIKNGANVKAKNKDGKTAWDYIQENKALKNTKAYWMLNDLQYK
ncbi:MAG: ankyrin repeat domain-containing protein [Alphaproteobacteria bacterium]